MRGKKVLIIDDDIPLCGEISNKLRDQGVQSIVVHNGKKALSELKRNASEIGVALIDQHFPEKPHGHVDEALFGKGAGIKIARRIRELHPQVRLIGMSVLVGQEVREWFAEFGYAFLRKDWLSAGASPEFIDVIVQAATKPFRKKRPQCFIVHGHDNQMLQDLCYFIERGLKWPHPKILRELPSEGRTLIEKFEDATRNVDIVFVLLTPDDRAVAVSAPDDLKRRARQNVIFELGYFYGKLQRIGGKILLLHKGGVELPSDIGSITWIDVSAGIEASGEELRRQMNQWL